METVLEKETYTLISKRLCMAKDIGINGNLFGGNMLSYLDETGAIYAAEIIKSPRIVTVKMDSVEFKNPVKIGNIIYIYGKVLRIGKTSITLNLKAMTHDVETNNEVCVCETNMVFVKVDNNGKAVAI